MKSAAKSQLTGTRQLPMNEQNLRAIVETEIERLLVILDSLDGDSDMEPSLAGYSDGMDDREGDEADGPEEDPAERGVADLDGYMEQYQPHFQNCDQLVE